MIFSFRTTMGDCRIRFLEPSESATGTGTSATKSPPLTEVSARVLASDTTVYDCFHSVTTKTGRGTNLWDALADHVVSIWDCTKYPPSNMTETCLASGREMTLYAAGWFPSGTLQILPPEADGIVFASADAHQDFQFNHEQTQLNPKESVRLIGKTFDRSISQHVTGGTLKVSQVLDAIPDRFKQQNNDEVDDDERDRTADAVRLRQQNKQKRRAVEAERARKLDERIRKLNDQPSSSKTSALVRRMLIKSRATGRKTLREEDRVYLHVCIDGGNDGVGEDYRFFSLQDTVGAALGSFHGRSQAPNSEMLVSLDGCYYRLPSGLRFLDAIERKAMTPEVMTVVVRFFTEGETTTSIDERVVEDKGGPVQAVAPNEDMSLDSQTIPHEGADSCFLGTDAVAEIKLKDDSIASLLDKLREMYPTPAKKQSPTLLKVQQMKIKGKAQGDPKRIKSVDDRFFFELVIVSHSQNDGPPISKGPVYYALTDPVDRCCADIRELQTKNDWKVWVFTAEQLQPIASSAQSSRSKSWQSLLQDGDVAQFSIIVWCVGNDS
jgi:hypothetical protein